MSTTTGTWASVVAQLAPSGVPLREFAQKHGYNRSALPWWCWRLWAQIPTVEKPQSAFVELEPREPRESRPREPVRIRPDGRAWLIEVDQDTDLDLVARLLDRIA